MPEHGEIEGQSPAPPQGGQTGTGEQVGMKELSPPCLTVSAGLSQINTPMGR